MVNQILMDKMKCNINKKLYDNEEKDDDDFCHNLSNLNFKINAMD